MAIEWTTRPDWKLGYGAKSMDADSLMRHIYPYYSADTWELKFDANTWFGYRFYQKTPSLTSRYGVTNPRGSAIGAWLGLQADAAITYEGPIYTIAYPTAERKFQMYMKVYQFYGSWNCEINARIVMMDGLTVDPDLSSTGFTASVGWNTTNLKCPGQFAIWYVYGGTSYEGFTVWGGEGGSSQVYGGDVYLLDPVKITQDLMTHNPGVDWGAYEVITESPEAGPASEAGGYGGYGGDITASDSIAVPALPSASAAALGFINMYNPSSGGLSSLGEEIFPDLDFTSIVDPTGNSVIDAILNACAAFVDCFNQIPKMFEIFINSRLIDYVQDCHIVPVAPTVGASAHIKLGFRELDTTAPTITNEYVEISLGTVNVNEFYGQFIDYQPYTRAKLFLPFVGFVPIEPEYWQSGTLGVVYHFNVYDGSFMVFVTASPNGKVSQMSSSVIGQYAGTAIVHLPLTGLNYSSMVAGLVGGVGAASNAIASGNVAAGLTAAINTATSSPQVLSSNAYTASAAFMGCRLPFLIIERSVSHFPQKYQHDVGIPSKITTNLASASGFTSIGDIDLSSVNATDREKDEIRSIIASGIYV